jgi:DNA-binding response OmpR family regulator
VKKILIVEDDIDTVEIVRYLLEDGGYAVVKIERSMSVNEVAEINPDLAVIDFLLPQGLGDELCLKIKTNAATKHIPVILYSASIALEKIVSNCKADAYIAKPFDVDFFMSEIKRLIA